MAKSKEIKLPEDMITEIPSAEEIVTGCTKQDANCPTMLTPRPYAPIEHHVDFLMLFDVKNGNPNGDPDAGGAPRISADSYGLITDGCLKHKIRDIVPLLRDPDDPYYKMYVRRGMSLNARDNCALNDLFGVTVTVTDDEDDAPDNDDADKKPKKAKKSATDKITAIIKADPNAENKIVAYACENFYDVRTFGAVMTTYTKVKLSCGQLRGPVQIGISETVDPVYPQELTITREALTKDSDADDKNNTMGRRTIIPYGLYRCEGHISAPCAAKTNFTEEDLRVLWEAILHMFDEDRASMRGEMTLRHLIVFTHRSRLANAPAYKLFDKVKIVKKDGVEEPRYYDDYVVTIDADNMPDGVTCVDMVD